jgi:hypothetical protein
MNTLANGGAPTRGPDLWIPSANAMKHPTIMPIKTPPGSTNYAVLHQDALRQRHYVLNSPTHPRRWVAFAPRRVAAFQARHGDDFCLVIVGDPASPEDFYALPWREVSALFVQHNTYPAPQKNGRVSLRWQIHLEGPSHFFQFELAPTDTRPRPRFDATAWYGNYTALAAPVVTDDDTPLADLLAGDATFPEGRRIAVLHYRRERSPHLVQQAKERFRAHHGRLFCEVCGFDFQRIYGVLGDGFIEAHHVVPLKSLPEDAETRVEDLRMVCANCHRMLHRGKQWPTVSELTVVVTIAEKAG